MSSVVFGSPSRAHCCGSAIWRCALRLRVRFVLHGAHWHSSLSRRAFEPARSSDALMNSEQKPLKKHFCDHFVEQAVHASCTAQRCWCKVMRPSCWHMELCVALSCFAVTFARCRVAIVFQIARGTAGEHLQLLGLGWCLRWKFRV